MQWCIINNKYLDYLKETESRVPNYSYENQRKDGTTKKLFKPFFAVILENNDFSYVAQVNHPQPRHNSMIETLDFIKLFDPKDTKKILCVVNLNYMFPVPKKEISYLDNNSIGLMRDFDSPIEKQNYIMLLGKEMAQINNRNLEQQAAKLFYRVKNNPNSSISKRCFNYTNLEQKCAEWTRLQTLDKIKNNQSLLVNDKGQAQMWEYYHTPGDVLYQVVGQSNSKRNFISSAPKQEVESEKYDNLNLYEIKNNQFNIIANLSDEVDEYGIGNIGKIIDNKVREIVEEREKHNKPNQANKSKKLNDMIL